MLLVMSAFMKDEGRARHTKVDAQLDRIDRLLIEDPAAAYGAATLVPILVEGLDHDLQARAYTCLGIACLKIGARVEAMEALSLAERLAVGTSSSTRALVKLRTTALVIADGRYAEAEAMLEEALQLASDEPSGSLLGRIQMKRGNLSFRRGHFAVSAERFGRAVDTLPNDHYLRSCAAWNLMLAVYHLDSRTAPSLLRFMSYHDLRCRRRVAKRMKKTVPTCMICWAEGYLSGLVGYQPHAVRCLSWAANALFELGAVREATLCALDLVTFEPSSFGKVHQIVSALADDPSTPPTVRDAARLWLTSTGNDKARIVRDHLLQGRQTGVESD